MGFGDTSLLCKIVFILLILCFIIDLIAFAIPYWYSKEINGFKYYGGLWDICEEGTFMGSSYKICNSIGEDDRYIAYNWVRGFRAVRAFSILSWLFFLAALVLVVIFMWVLSSKVLYLVAVCLSFAGAFCAMIAFAVYAGESTFYWKDYSASFALTIIAFILGLIIGILGILDYLGLTSGKVGA
ncbi:hypothetical protein CHS0354_039762 [Potamilus streckersoni]|uniref:Uncharacterized protein n=1 Tax=Potamilus streckersoni TaxID=2493646 RepID=A0AAE0VM63_9BIVA|nr:hypothetical protein CHS0354_039762 [Potamilus streckersoni]